MTHLKPQVRDLLTYLERHGSVTPLEALSELGIYRLAARVSDLKAAGYGVTSELVTFEGQRFAVYRLAREPKQLQAFG